MSADTGAHGHDMPSAVWWALGFVIAGVAQVVITIALSWDRAAHGAAPFDAGTVVELLAFLMFVLLGGLLVLRRPRHPIGWLLSALGLAVLLQQIVQAYAVRGHALPSGAGLPGWQFASWVLVWSIAPPLILLIEVLLLFPTGRPSSRAWTGVAWVVAVGGVVLTIGWAVASWPQRGVAAVTAGVSLPTALELLRSALIACVPVAVLSLLWRFRRAAPDERQQLKWLALAATALMASAVAGLVTAALGRTSRIVDAAGMVSIAGVAVSMTLAVLRYRLYEIDRLLSRTVSYGVLSALLVALYSVAVVTVGALLGPVARDSSPAVAVSTLIVAAAFAPLRARTQHVVDRHFNRPEHDRQREVGAFGSRLRADVRLEDLRSDLLAVVDRVVAPHTVSIWLRPSPGGLDALRPPYR